VNHESRTGRDGPENGRGLHPELIAVGMKIEIAEAPIATVADLARIPIAFTVDRVLDVEERDGAIVLTERALDVPWVKDYDALPGEAPAALAARFDLSRWGLIVARADGRLVGGAVIAFDTPGVDMLRGRRDLAALWDLRVSPELRGRGVGAALFRAAEAWAAARGCAALEVETQNVNAAACRFYARMGCAPASIDRSAYPALPHEVQLIWRKELTTGRDG
jgi:ribosomal protein S18 acetylase RimI-like enzyme